MSGILKLVMAIFAVITVAVVVDGFRNGAWFDAFIYVVFVVAALGQWATIRRESDDAKSAADRMLVGVLTLMIWIARPALHSLSTLTFG